MKGCQERLDTIRSPESCQTLRPHPIYISEVKTLKHKIPLSSIPTVSSLLRPEEKGILRPVLGSRLQSHLPGMVCLSYDRRRYEMVSYRANETAPYVDLPAGKYTFAVRYQWRRRWLDNERKLIIEIQPYWYEKQAYAGAWPYFFLLSIAGGWWLIDRYAQKQTLKQWKSYRHCNKKSAHPTLSPRRHQPIIFRSRNDG